MLIHRILSFAMQAGPATIIWGNPGLGKSKTLESIAKAWNEPIETITASNRDPSDFGGLPVRTEDGVSFEPMAWAKRLEQAGKGIFFGDELSCFVGNTKIEKADGSHVPISSLREGDVVWGYDLSNSRRRANLVLRQFARHDKKVAIEMRLSNGQHIICTPEHKFYTQQGWTEARNIRRTDSLSIMPEKVYSNNKHSSSEITSSNHTNSAADFPQYEIYPREANSFGSSPLYGDDGWAREREAHREKSPKVEGNHLFTFSRMALRQIEAGAKNYASEIWTAPDRSVGQRGRICCSQETSFFERANSERGIEIQPIRTRAQTSIRTNEKLANRDSGKNKYFKSIGSHRWTNSIAIDALAPNSRREKDDSICREELSSFILYREWTKTSDDPRRISILEDAGLFDSRTAIKSDSFGSYLGLTSQWNRDSGLSKSRDYRSEDFSSRDGRRDLVAKQNHQLFKIGIDEIRYLEIDEPVYDLTTYPDHNFFAEGVLVHNCAPIACQHALLRVFLDRQVGDLALPKTIRMVGAANPADIANGWELTPPMANRFIHLNWAVTGEYVEFWQKGLLEGWDEAVEFPKASENWEQEHLPNARVMVSSYIKSTPSALFDMPKDESKRSGPWPSPRTWEFASRVLAVSWNESKDIQLPLITGCIGEGHAVAFMTWKEKLDLPNPMDLLNDPDSFEIPKEPDRLYVILHSVVTTAISNPSLRTWDATWQIVLTAIKKTAKDIPTAAVLVLVNSKAFWDEGKYHLPPEAVKVFSEIFEKVMDARRSKEPAKAL